MTRHQTRTEGLPGGVWRDPREKHTCLPSRLQRGIHLPHGTVPPLPREGDTYRCVPNLHPDFGTVHPRSCENWDLDGEDSGHRTEFFSLPWTSTTRPNSTAPRAPGHRSLLTGVLSLTEVRRSSSRLSRKFVCDTRVRDGTRVGTEFRKPLRVH